jgi:cytochrome c peroxidase
MGEVIHLRPQPEDLQAELWATFAAAFTKAQAEPNLPNMAKAIRAYEAWLCVVFPDEADRRVVWP